MLKEIIVTFAIPTYNRLWKLKETINEILKYPGEDIEILISDDSTNEDTKEYIDTLEDDRVRYTRRINPIVIPGLIPYAKGKYMFYLFDKDMIINEGIARFISFLKRNKDVTYGRCLLNCFEKRISKKEYEIFNQGYEGIKSLAYYDWHPSGFFFDIEKGKKYLRKSTIKMHSSCWYADLAFSGRGASYQLPLIKIETAREAVQTKTIKSSNKTLDDMLFGPKVRKEKFQEYVRHLSTVHIAKKKKIEISEEIAERLMEASTVGYRVVLSNKQVCIHYGVKTQRISTTELRNISFRFGIEATQFINSTLKLNLIETILLGINIFLITSNNIKKIYS